MNIKQLFCTHIWQNKKSVDLERSNWRYDFALGSWVKYKKVAQHRICVICQKESWAEDDFAIEAKKGTFL